MGSSRRLISIKKLFKELQPLCKAIYLGGSRANPYIKHPHDYDYILFAEKESDIFFLKRKLCDITHPRFLPIFGLDDFMNVRSIEQEEHSYGSYINILQKKIVGQDIEFKFDVINKDREEYINILLITINKLKNKKIRNVKRYYQILNGIFILENNSYELTKEQIKIINEVHDQVEGWEKYLSIVDEWEKKHVNS